MGLAQVYIVISNFGGQLDLGILHVGNRCRGLSVSGLDPSLRSSCEIQRPVSVEPEIVDTEAIIRLSLRTNRRARRRRGTVLNIKARQAALNSRRLGSKRRKSYGLLMSHGCPRLSSEEHTSELQSLIPISYAVYCLKTKKPYNPSN